MTRYYLLDELDKILALVGAIFSLALTIWLKSLIDYPIYEMIGILCFIVCTGYLVIRRFFYPLLIPSLDELRCSTRSYIILNILFFLLLSYSIVSLYLRQDPYIRSLSYFISTALMAAIVANDILFLSSQKSHVYSALCKIIIIGLSLQYSQILIFPNMVGTDPWWHQWFTLKILDEKYIPEGLAYSKLPITHLIIGTTSLVTGLSHKMATIFSISSLQVICDALFVFLLGSFLISTKVGLLAALLLEVANYHIPFGYWAIPNTTAAILILPIIFIILKFRRDKPFIGTSIIMFIMGTLILTHTLTSMFLAILLFVFWFSSEVYTRLFHQETGRSLTWTICILFSIGMLAYWSYISGHIITLSNIIKLGFRNSLYIDFIPYTYDFTLWEKVFGRLGAFLFFSLSFIGCFYMMSKQFRNSNRFTTTIGGIIILCLAFIPTLVGIYIIVDRWYYFSQILLAIPLSLSLLLLVGAFRNNWMKSFLLSISIFALSFLLIISPFANIDNRFFSPNIGIRSTFIESELYAMDTISKIWNGIIGSDHSTMLPLELTFNQEFVNIDDSIYDGDFNDLQGILLLIRKEIVNHSFRIRSGSIRLKYDIHVALSHQNFSRIYDCGSTSGYLS